MNEFHLPRTLQSRPEFQIKKLWIVKDSVVQLALYLPNDCMALIVVLIGKFEGQPRSSIFSYEAGPPRCFVGAYLSKATAGVTFGDHFSLAAKKRWRDVSRTRAELASHLEEPTILPADSVKH
jgi:hypothetical protein